jgi:hypothetical protein
MRIIIEIDNAGGTVSVRQQDQAVRGEAAAAPASPAATAPPDAIDAGAPPLDTQSAEQPPAQSAAFPPGPTAVETSGAGPADQAAGPAPVG